MDQQDLLEFIMDHYENPRNYGAREDADVVLKGGNPGCGDIVTIYLNLDDKNRVQNVTFEGEGCTISQAATSMVTEMVLGKPVEEVEDMSVEVILDIVGKQLAMTRPRCVTLGLNTVKMAIKKWKDERIRDSLKES